MQIGRNNLRVLGSEEGAVLLLVLWVVALISVLVLSWAQEWRTEVKLAAHFREAHKCRRLAEAGVYYAIGKMVTSKSIEERGMEMGQELATETSGTWQGDQRLYRLEMPGGWAEVHVADEAGKLNLNLASEKILANLFSALGYEDKSVMTMVASILDWRSSDRQLRVYGAKSNYYLSLDPPYPARNDKFEVVEELSWVRGFENTTLLPRWADCLTVQKEDNEININTAPLEVLQACGISSDLARNLIATRQEAPFRQLSGVSELTRTAAASGFQTQFTVRSSSFFTIKSTGKVRKDGGRHTIKALVRIDPNSENLWEMISWTDDFPE
jgi:general secretion pathway protein K